jgi:hypothetical protein
MKKCPVCNWEIKDKGITVKDGGREVVVCCKECADKVKEKAAKSAR